MTDSYNEADHDWTEHLPYYNAFNAPATKAAIALLELPATGATVLDVGCGPGGIIPHLAAAVGSTGKIVGIDGSAKNLDAAKRHIAKHHLESVVEFHKLNLADPLPFAENTFDLVWIADVILPDFAENPPDFVRRLTRVLKPGGVCAIYYGNWLRLFMLPGYSRLENQIWAAQEINLSENGTPAHRSWNGPGHPESVLAWMQGAGLVEPRIEMLPALHRQPLSDAVRHFVGIEVFGSYMKGAIETCGDRVGLTAEDIQLWKRLVEPESAEYLLNRPDYYCGVTAIFAMAKKP